MNDLTPTDVFFEAQTHLNEYTFSTFINKNEQSLDEPTIFPSLSTSIELSYDTEKAVFFFKKEGKGRNVDLKSLVSVPSIKYAKILNEADDLYKHSKNVHHINAIQTTSDFLTCYKNPAKKIINVVNSTRMNQIILKHIIELTIFFLTSKYFLAWP